MPCTPPSLTMSSGPLVKDVENLLLSKGKQKCRRQHNELPYPITYCKDLADLYFFLVDLPNFQAQVVTTVIFGTTCSVLAIVKA